MGCTLRPWLATVSGVVFVLAVVVLAAAAPGVWADGVVEIVAPPGGQPIFGQVEVEVVTDDSVVRVDLWLDGRRVAPQDPKRDPLTLHWTVDVGDANVLRLLEAVAWGHDGELGRHRVEYPPVIADDVVGIELQQLYVSVSDGAGERVLGLRAADFRVFDEGKPQELVTFAAGDIPWTALLLVDGSASMAGEPMRAAASGVRRFGERLEQNDEAKVLVVSDQILSRSPWTDQAEALVEAIEGVDTGGGSALLDHLYMGLGLVEARHGRRVVILLSDGIDLHSVLDIEQVRRVARHSQAMVYWLRLGEAPSRRELRVDSASRAAAGGRSGVYFRTPQRVPLSSWRSSREAQDLARPLGELVEQSGGRVVAVEGVDGIGDALAEIAAELRQQYALGYAPQPRRNDGSWRRVRIRLPGHRGLQTRTRQGYVDR